MTQQAVASLPSGVLPAGRVPAKPLPEEATELRLRFEQMLWSEMLSHAGLEKSLTLGGGEGASAFSRFVVEAIAKDLAEKHPLGLGDKVLASVPAESAEEGRSE